LNPLTYDYIYLTLSETQILNTGKSLMNYFMEELNLPSKLVTFFCTEMKRLTGGIVRLIQKAAFGLYNDDPNQVQLNTRENIRKALFDKQRLMKWFPSTEINPFEGAENDESLNACILTFYVLACLMQTYSYCGSRMDFDADIR